MSQITVGTVGVTNGNATVVGDVDCSWSGVTAGMIFTILNSNIWYTVLSRSFVTDHWEIILTTTYAGTTLAGQSYVVHSSFTPSLGIPHPEQGDVNTASLFKRAMLFIETLLLRGTLSTSLTNGIGYAAGSSVGGTVTQATSKATAFTLSKLTGEITLNGAALGADTTVSATWTNTTVAAKDIIAFNHISGGTLGAYTFNAVCSAGSVQLNIRNVTPGSLSEAPVIRFAVIKAATT